MHTIHTHTHTNKQTHKKNTPKFQFPTSTENSDKGLKERTLLPIKCSLTLESYMVVEAHPVRLSEVYQSVTLTKNITALPTMV